MNAWSAWMHELDEGAKPIKEVELESTDMADIGSTVISLDTTGRNLEFVLSHVISYLHIIYSYMYTPVYIYIYKDYCH